MDDLSEKTEWKEFSLFKENEIEVSEVYKKIVIVDLKGKHFEFNGRFSVIPKRGVVVAKALP